MVFLVGLNFPSHGEEAREALPVDERYVRQEQKTPREATLAARELLSLPEPDDRADIGEVETRRLVPGLVQLDRPPERAVSNTLNVEELARGTLDGLDWSFGEQVAFASRGVDLVPGDVIGSGTIPGGCLLEHVDPADPAKARWLRPGDVVSLRGDELGETARPCCPPTCSSSSARAFEQQRHLLVASPSHP